jgi:PhnB protein
MTSKTPVPTGYHTITPYLFLKNAAAAIEFYKKAFNATVIIRMERPDGKIGHADLKIGDSHVMLADESEQMKTTAPGTIGGTTFCMHLYVPNVDEFFKQAIKAGATEKNPVEDRFYGDRTGALTDPFGHQWSVSTHVEDVPVDEINRRFEAMFQPQ